MLAGSISQERTLEELRDRAIKARLIAKSMIDPVLWVVTTVFFIFMPYGVWYTTKDTGFTISYTAAFLAMPVAVWVGKKFISVTFLKWYVAWQRKQFQKEMYDKLYYFYLRKYENSSRKADKWAKETMLCDVSSILEFLENEERRI